MAGMENSAPPSITAEVIWNADYRVPGESNDDVCDYPLARNLVMMTVAVACEVIVRFLTEGQRKSFTLTQGDLRVRPFPPVDASVAV